MPTGAVSCLSYADRLNQLPLGIVGIAVSTTLLPLLSRHVEAGAEDNVRHYTSRALEFCLMLGLLPVEPLLRPCLDRRAGIGKLIQPHFAPLQFLRYRHPVPGTSV